MCAVFNAYKDIAIFDPALLPLLSTESLTLIPDGTQYSRVEKVLNILKYEPVYRYLNVCVSGDDTHENCSVCSKCSRTLMTLNSMGKLDQFGHLFDIDKYRMVAEKQYVREQVIAQNKDPFAKGNVELAKKNRLKLPNKAYCFLLSILGLTKTQIVKVLSSVLPVNTKNKLKRILKR